MQTTFTLEHLELNLDRTYGSKPNPLADVRVRQALALALDKSALVQSALQVGKKAAAGYAAWSPFVNAPDLKQPFVTAFPSGQWDPISGKFVTPGTRAAVADAQRLLKGTPYKNGFSLDLYTTSESVIRQLEEGSIAASWEKLKVKLVPNFVSDASLLGSWADGGIATRGKFQVALFSYLGSPDPDGYRFNLAGRYCNRSARVHSTLNGNNSCVHDALIDRSFADAARNLDPARRAADYNAVAAQVNKQAYWIPLYFRPTVVTDDGRVANVSLNPTPLGLTWNVDAWRVRGA
ncbi:MAG: hypothetical protein JOZ41_00240 [Chloroflexi bacterium]|nr:hypothetical protein [Chloroflexota bacterium]